MTNMKLHIIQPTGCNIIINKLSSVQKVAYALSLVPKLMTFDDLEWLFALCFKIRAYTWSHHENLNEGRPMLSAARM